MTTTVGPRTVIIIDVNGIPVGQGAVSYSSSGHGYHTNSKQLKPWRAMIINEAVEAWGGAAPWTGPVECEASFRFPYLKSQHYRSNGQLKDDAPLHKITAPDLDHLQRAVGDALEQAGAIVSDAQICSWTATKSYSQKPGLYLIIRRI